MPDKVTQLYDEATEWLSKAKQALMSTETISDEKQTEINSWIANADKIKKRAQQLESLLQESNELDVAAKNKAAQIAASVQATQKRKEFDSFAKYMIAVYNAEKHGRVDERLSAIETRDLTGEIGIDGGFLIPTEFKKEILAARAENTIVRSRATVVDMASRTIQYPSIDHSGTTAGESRFFGGVAVNWMEENASITESQPKFMNVPLHARLLAGYTEVSNMLLSDSAIALNSFLRGPMSFGGAIGWSEDYAFLRGDGVGKPLGVLNSPAALAVTRNTANDFKFVDAVTMKSKLLMNAPSVWVINQSVMPKLYQFQGGDSANIFVTNAPSGTPETLLGSPIIWTEKLPALGTAGDVMLCDFSMYLIGNRNDLAMDISKEFRFQNNMTAFRITQSVDGQPWLSGTITLADGSTAVSPFVYLS